MWISKSTGLFGGLKLGRRATVAVWIAMMAPGLIMATSMAVEVGAWISARVGAQRAADVSALAGAMNYQATTNKQTAATFAARMAQMNGGVGTTAPSWNSSTNTLTDNQITVQIVSSVANASGNAIQVTVQKNIPKTLSAAFSSTPSFTVVGQSTAELVNSGAWVGGGNSGGGGQPCLVALGNTGITTGTDVTVQGSVTINMPNCVIRSNDGVSASGSATIDSSGIYAGGTVSTGGSSNIIGQIYQNQGQLPDPYANNTALQSALSAANSATGSGAISCKGNTGSTSCTGPSGSFSCSGTSCTLQPGTYSGLTLTSGSILNLLSGKYIFTGNVSLGGGSTLIGTDITVLLSAGTTGSPVTMSVDGNAVFILAAATNTSATNGQIPGIVLASLSTGTTSLYTGSSSSPFIGVVYFPKAQISYTGTSYSGSPGCAEVIAKTIALTGNASFDSSTCSSYGAAAFTSLIPLMVARVVK